MEQAPMPAQGSQTFQCNKCMYMCTGQEDFFRHLDEQDCSNYKQKEQHRGKLKKKYILFYALSKSTQTKQGEHQLSHGKGLTIYKLGTKLPSNNSGINHPQNFFKIKLKN
jgi:uncharacterized C2H2 Zn-finger protein